jgi:hypothetical protein
MAGCVPLILIEAPSSADHRGTAGAGEMRSSRGGDRRRFSTTPHQFYWGIDWHVSTIDLCVLHQHGEMVLHRNMQTAPAPFLQAIALYRADLVGCGAGLFTWDLAGATAGRAKGWLSCSTTPSP